MKKVSIIITAYNCEKTIKRAIESCLNQTLEDIEIIIIDDGSTDSTSSIAKEYASAYKDKVLYFYKENEGVFSARNLGLEKISGEYFTFLDSDDYFDNDMAEDMYKVAIENNSDLVYSDFYYTYTDKEDKKVEPYYNDKKSMLVLMNATLWNKLYKTSTIKKIGVNFIDCTRFEDTSFLYKIVPFINRIDKINRSYLHYVQNDNSLVHSYDLKVLQVIKVFNDLYDYYKNNNIFEEYYNELEYTTIRYMLGQPYKYCCKISNKNDKKHALDSLWEHLNTNFPNWKDNVYLNKDKTPKNLYFKTVNSKAFYLYSKLFSK